MIHIRGMLPTDLDFAAECTQREGWISETREVFETFYTHDASGCLIAEVDGQRAGMCVLTIYGESAYFGEFIIPVEFRGQGIGEQMMRYAIDLLHGRGVQNILLDGVQRAVPLYERMGFRKTCRSLRLSGQIQGATSQDVRPMRDSDLSIVLAIDLAEFGADRSFFLKRRFERYSDLCHVLEEHGEIAGYIMARPRPDGLVVSPWVARPGSPHASDLLTALPAEGETIMLALGVLETNQASLDILHRYGFEENPTPPWRMVLGPSGDLATSAWIYGNGSAAKG